MECSGKPIPKAIVPHYALHMHQSHAKTQWRATHQTTGASVIYLNASTRITQFMQSGTQWMLKEVMKPRNNGTNQIEPIGLW